MCIRYYYHKECAEVNWNDQLCLRGESCLNLGICGLCHVTASALLTITAGDGFWACMVIILASSGLFLLFRCTRFAPLPNFVQVRW